MYRYLDFNSVQVEINYSKDLLLHNENIDINSKLQYVCYNSYSDKINIQLPFETSTAVIDTETDKSYVYHLDVCLKNNDEYCFILRHLYRYHLINNKTHKGGRLVVFDDGGNEKYSFKTTADEWILDCFDDSVLLFNLKENSFYLKNITSGALRKTLTAGCRDYDKIVLNQHNFGWEACYYNKNSLIHREELSPL